MRINATELGLRNKLQPCGAKFCLWETECFLLIFPTYAEAQNNSHFSGALQ